MDLLWPFKRPRTVPVLLIQASKTGGSPHLSRRVIFAQDGTLAELVCSSWRSRPRYPPLWPEGDVNHYRKPEEQRVEDVEIYCRHISSTERWLEHALTLVSRQLVIAACADLDAAEDTASLEGSNVSG